VGGGRKFVVSIDKAVAVITVLPLPGSNWLRKQQSCL